MNYPFKTFKEGKLYFVLLYLQKVIVTSPRPFRLVKKPKLKVKKLKHKKHNTTNRMKQSTLNKSKHSTQKQ